MRLLVSQKSLLSSAALLLAAAMQVWATGAMDRGFEEASHQSQTMGREMSYRILLPRGYSAKGNEAVRYPVVYLLHGLWGSYDNWTDKNPPRALVRENVIVVTPEGGNGWYVDGVGGPAARYESYFVRDLVLEIDSKFRTKPAREFRFVAGLSMGGYGAVKFGLKYPGMFSMVGSFSGALDAPLRTQSNALLNAPIVAVFGDEESPVRAANDIFSLADAVNDEARQALPFIYFDCGSEDWLIETNREFSKLLLRKKIPHEFRQLPGGHNWTYWNAQVHEFFRLVDLRLASGNR
jgi:S-formylglutathione hydrolase FrmB